ncbi:MAG: hybrid sensor histidine kinase/response regulator [Desulfobacteraceae bacterium]|nr:hybrid sensor histidine kinase/response regulator [Desulfobacteraceae bacterium]
MNNEKESFILIVDDNPKNLQVLGNILREKKHKTAIAKSGVQALKFVEKKLPDLILLDIMMPEMDGFETCQNLKGRSDTRNIPVIFISALSDTSEKLKGFQAGGVDYITKPFQQEEVFARVDAHLKLKHSQEDLRNANATKDKLFSIIGHDLRAPLGTLIQALEMMVDNPDMLDEKERLEIMNDLMISTKRAYNLLENLLYWARSQRGEIDYSPFDMEINTIVDDNIRLLSGIAKDKSVNLYSEIKEPVQVHCDADMITTVIRNLIANALKFTPESGEIRINAVLKEDDKETVEVSVADNGVGIAKENMDKLFRSNEFFTTYGTKNEKGSGLGLMLCKEFVKKNRGKIWVESEQGKGSEFKFTLPKVRKGER